MKLILVNPGKTERNSWTNKIILTEVALAETRKLAKIIASLVENNNVAIYSSTEGDTEESALIIGEALGVRHKSIDYCCQQDFSTNDIAIALEAIDSCGNETVILLAEYSFLLKLLQQIIRIYQNIDTDINEIPDNYALFVDLEGGPPCLVGPDDDIYAEG